MNLKIKNLRDGISIVTINEPKTYNSLSFKNLKDLIKVFQKSQFDPCRIDMTPAFLDPIINVTAHSGPILLTNHILNFSVELIRIKQHDPC